MIDPDEVVAFMNEALETDREAISYLVGNRVVCTQVMADHPTIQVAKRQVEGIGEAYTVGLLGLLNGLCGAREDGWGFIAAVVEDDGMVSRFERLKR